MPSWLAVGMLAVGAVVALALTRLCHAWDDHGAGQRLSPGVRRAAIAPYALAAVVVYV